MWLCYGTGGMCGFGGVSKATLDFFPLAAAGLGLTEQQVKSLLYVFIYLVCNLPIVILQNLTLVSPMAGILMLMYVV